jgi:L-fuconolactonase
MTVIDAHVHLWNLDAHPQPWTEPWPVLHRSFGAADLRAVLAAHAVDAAIVVQAVVGWADFTADDLPAQLQRLRIAPGGDRLVGLRHQLQVEPDKLWLAREEVRHGLRVLAEQDLVFDVVVSPEQLPLVTETVRALTATRFVLDHAGKPAIGGDIAAWRTDIAVLAAAPNAAVKLSGLVTEAVGDNWTQEHLDPVIDHVLDCFGPDRVMAGSDWPVCLLTADYGAVQSTLTAALARLDANGRDAIRGRTARRWYLKDTA